MKYLKQAWLVIVLSLGFGAALAAVQSSLGPKIAANKLAETMRQVPLLVPGTAADKTTAITVEDTVVYRAQNASGKLAGWVIPARGQGFADTIELLIGLDASGETITGLFVLAQKETPGLGDFITGKWREQFAGKKTLAPLTVVKKMPGTVADSEIAAVTGATISSESVKNIVNAAVEKFRGKLPADAQ